MEKNIDLQVRVMWKIVLEIAKSRCLESWLELALNREFNAIWTVCVPKMLLGTSYEYYAYYRCYEPRTCRSISSVGAASLVENQPTRARNDNNIDVLMTTEPRSRYIPGPRYTRTLYRRLISRIWAYTLHAASLPYNNNNVRVQCGFPCIRRDSPHAMYPFWGFFFLHWPPPS